MNLGKDGLILIGIVILALIIFAPSVVPRLTKSFGKSMKGFQEGMEGKEPDDEEPSEPAPKEMKAAEDKPAPAPEQKAERVESKDQEAI